LGKLWPRCCFFGVEYCSLVVSQPSSDLQTMHKGGSRVLCSSYKEETRA